MSAVDGGSHWPERSIRPNAAFALGRANSGLAIRRGEIVEEIVLNLRPWKDRISETTVTAEVNGELD